jgi:hypothetical protein
MARQIGDVNSSASSERQLTSQVKNIISRHGSAMFNSGVVSVNGMTESEQTFATGTAGETFNIQSSNGVHIFNIPNASKETKGLLSAHDWTIFNSKQDKIEKQSPSVDECEFSQNSGEMINENSTFGGYTLKQVIQALKNANILE